MTSIVFGVIDLPYADAQSYKTLKARKPKVVRSSSLTTGDVAEILEAQYQVMGHFVEYHGKEIADDLEDSYAKALNAILDGAPPTFNPAGAAVSAIQNRFREFLYNREMDNKVPGVPTEAAKKGQSKRFKRASKKRKDRPSFIDTGLYEASFIVWVE